MTRRLEEGERRRRGAPARTSEEKNRHMAGLAFDLAEKQLIDGTASAQVIVHFLKAETERNRLELEKLRKETLLLEARESSYLNAERSDEMYQRAIEAFRGYQGLEVVDYDGE